MDDADAADIVCHEDGEFLKSLCSSLKMGKWCPDPFIFSESLLVLEMMGGDMGSVSESEEDRWRIEEYFVCGGEAWGENKVARV